MKKRFPIIFVSMLMLFFGVAATITKISEYPNRAPISESDLLLLASTGVTNYNASYFQLKTNLYMGSNAWSGITVFPVGANVVHSNQYTRFYTPGATLAEGTYLEFHRPNRITDCAQVWFNDDMGPSKYLAMGLDVAAPDSTFFYFYTKANNKDIMTIGMETNNLGCFGFNSVPGYAASTIAIDSDLIGGPTISQVMYMYCRTNGLKLDMTALSADLVELTRDNFAKQGWLKFTVGSTGNWRVGVGASAYDLVFYNSLGVAGSSASPGSEVFKIHSGPASGGQTYVYADKEPFFGQSMTSIDMPIPGTQWDKNNNPTVLWFGAMFVIGDEDMILRKIGRHTAYGFTNSAHTIMLLHQPTTNGAVVFTNCSMVIPKKLTGNRWVWSNIPDAYLPAGSTNFIACTADSGDFYGDSVIAHIDTNVVYSSSFYDTSSWTTGPPGIGKRDPGHNYGPVNYIRDF